MNMKHLNISLAASLAIAVAISPTDTFAIDAVIDMAAIVQLAVNATQQAAQAASALTTAKDGIDQVRQQYDNYKSLVSGNDQLGNFLNNPALNKVLPLSEWSDVYTSVQDLASLRERYGLKSDNATVQQQFDRYLAAADALERNYNASTQRVANAEQLRAQLNQVQTPQQKQDLQLRYQQELLEQQNQQMRLTNMNMLMKQQEKIDNTKRAQDFSDYMTGKSKVLPKYE